MSKSSIWPIYSTLSGATTPGQNRSSNNSNEEILHIPQNSKIGVSPSDGLMSYPGHSLWGGGLTPLQRYSWCILLPQQTKFNPIKEQSWHVLTSNWGIKGFKPFPRVWSRKWTSKRNWRLNSLRLMLQSSTLATINIGFDLIFKRVAHLPLYYWLTYYFYCVLSARIRICQLDFLYGDQIPSPLKKRDVLAIALNCMWMLELKFFSSVRV